MEPIQTCTTKQIEHQGLRIIIGIMCNGEYIEAMLMTKLGKPAIAQVTGRHFDTYAILAGICHSIKTLDEYTYSQRSGILFDQRLVSVTLLAS